MPAGIETDILKRNAAGDGLRAFFGHDADGAVRHGDGIGRENGDIVAVGAAGEDGVRDRDGGAVAAERAAVKAQLVGLAYGDGAAGDGDLRAFGGHKRGVVDLRLQLEAAAARDRQIARGGYGRTGVARFVAAAEQRVFAAQRQRAAAAEPQERLVARDAHVLKRQARFVAGGEREVVKRSGTGVEAHERYVKPAGDRNFAAGQPRDKVCAGGRDPAAGDEILPVDGGDGHVAARERELRPRGAVTIQLRKFGRFDGRVAAFAGHFAGRLAVGEEGHGERFGQRRVLRRILGLKCGTNVGGRFFRDLAAAAKHRQSRFRRRAAAPDEILRVADDGAGRRARLGIGRGDGRFVSAREDGRFVARGRIARDAAGIAVGAGDCAVVRAFCHDAREAARDAARAVSSGAGRGDGSKIGAAGERVGGRIAQAHDAAEPGQAGDGAVVQAIFHCRAVADVGGDAARVRPGGGYGHVGADILDRAAFGVGDEARGIRRARFTRGTAADGEIFERGVHAAAEQRRIAAGVIRIQREDRVSLPVERAREGLLDARTDGRPGARAGRAVDVGEGDVVSKQNRHTGKADALLIHELCKARELARGGERIGFFRARVPARVGKTQPALAARGAHGLDRDGAVAGDGIGAVGVLRRAGDEELIALAVFKRSVGGPCVGVGVRLEREDIALAERVAGMDRLTGDGGHGGAGQLVARARDGQIARIRIADGEKRGLDLLEGRREDGIARDGVVIAENRLAVGGERRQAVARGGLRGQRDGRAERHGPGLRDGERAVRAGALRQLAHTGFGAGFKPQNGIAAVFPGGIRCENAAVCVELLDKRGLLHLFGGQLCDRDGDFAARAFVIAVRVRIVVAAIEIEAARDGIRARVVAADAAAVLHAVCIDRAGVVAVIDVHALVRAEDAACRAGVGRGDRAGVVAAADRALAPCGADDAAHALGIGIADGGPVRAVFDDDAVGRFADSSDDAADHPAAVDRPGGEDEIAHGRLPAVCKDGLGFFTVHAVRVVRVSAEEAHDADGHAVGEALGRVAVAVEVIDAVPLSVEHAVEARVEGHAVARGFRGLHGEFAADGRPVGAGPRAAGVLTAAHVKIGGDADRLIREIHAAGIDRVGDVAAARADEQHVVDALTDKIRRVAHDFFRGWVSHAVAERGQTRELGGRVDLVFRFFRVVP